MEEGAAETQAGLSSERTPIWHAKLFVKAPSIQPLLNVLRETREFLARPDNEFLWSEWENGTEAVGEIDTLIARIESGDLPKRMDLAVLFAPTGSIQEVSLSSGWGEEFLRLSERFDAALRKT